MRKLKLIFIALIILSSAFCGCSTVNLEDDDAEDSEYPEPEIKDIVLRSFGGSINSQVAMDLMENFNMDNPEFTITIQLSGADTASVAAALTAGTNVPDLVNHHSIKEFYYANLLQSMEPYIALDPSFDREDFHYMVYAFNEIGGELWSLTCSALPIAMMYNKTMMEENGLDPDSPPQHWSKMLEMQNTLTRIDGRGRTTQTGYADMHLDGGGGLMWCAVNFYDGTNYMDDYGGFEHYVDNDSMYNLIEFYRDLASVYGGSLSRMSPELSGSDREGAFRKGLVCMILAPYTAYMIGNDFSCGIAPFPNSDHIAPEMYANVYAEDTYMIVRNCNNPEGAWFYLKWYNSNGLIITENYNFQLSPSTYFPRFMTNTYTRERISDMYYDEVNEETKQNIKKRDELMLTMSMTYNYEPTIPAMRGTVFNTAIQMVRDPVNYSDVRGRLKAIQKQVDSQRDTFLEDKIRQGWEFPDDYPWGIPPRDNE